MKTWPTLYHEGKKGEIRVWILSVNGDTCSTEYGTLNGQMQINKWVCTPKNEGKKNATTSEQQAIIEAEAKYTFQLERKYSTSINTAKQTLFLPMLAHDFAKKKKNLIYPVHVQPKLDGVRALARWEGNTVVLVSRSGKPYNVKHISKALENILPKTDIFDGEIYIHDPDITFETLMSWVKREQPDTVNLQYHIYDIPVILNQTGLTSVNRMAELSNWHDACIVSSVIKFVEPKICKSEQEILDFEKECIELGYEGGIVRLFKGLYLFGNRSSDLLKVKSFSDAEFTVVGFKVEEIRKVIAGQDRNFDAIIWVCEYTNNLGKKDTFTAKPIGKLEDRVKILNTVLLNPKKYFGKLYKVKYFEKTAANAPRFPIGLGFRLEEDL